VPPPIRAAWEEQARTHGDGWKLPPLAVPSLGRIGEDGIEADAARLLLDRRVAQPFGTYAESIQLTNPAAASLPRSYIYCADKTPDDPFLATIHYYRRFASDPAWRTYELATGHFPMLTAPGELTALLQQIAAA